MIADSATNAMSVWAVSVCLHIHYTQHIILSVCSDMENHKSVHIGNKLYHCTYEYVRCFVALFATYNKKQPEIQIVLCIQPSPIKTATWSYQEKNVHTTVLK